MIGEFTEAKGAEKGVVIKSLYVFAAAYCVCLVLFAVAQAILEIDLGRVSSIVSLIAAGQYAGSNFVKRVERGPEKEEKFKFALGGVLATVLVSVVLNAVVLALMGEGVQQSLLNLIASLPAMVVLGIAAFIGMLYFFILRWAFGSGAKNALKTL